MIEEKKHLIVQGLPTTLIKNLRFRLTATKINDDPFWEIALHQFACCCFFSSPANVKSIRIHFSEISDNLPDVEKNNARAIKAHLLEWISQGGSCLRDAQLRYQKFELYQLFFNYLVTSTDQKNWEIFMDIFNRALQLEPEPGTANRIPGGNLGRLLSEYRSKYDQGFQRIYAAHLADREAMAFGMSANLGGVPPIDPAVASVWLRSAPTLEQFINNPELRP